MRTERIEVGHVTAAAAAHTNLNTWHAVITLLEGGLLYGGRGHEASRKIIAICKAEAQKELRIFDRIRAAVK